MRMLEKMREEGEVIESVRLSTGQLIYRIGKPNVKNLVKKALAELS